MRPQVGLVKVLFGNHRIEGVTVTFGTAVHRIVLDSSVALSVLALALKSLDKRRTHSTGKVRVLAVGLVTSAPSWVAEYVYIGRPDGKTLVVACLARLFVLVVLCADLG